MMAALLLRLWPYAVAVGGLAIGVWLLVHMGAERERAAEAQRRAATITRAEEARRHADTVAGQSDPAVGLRDWQRD